MCHFQPEGIRDVRIPLRLETLSYLALYSYSTAENEKKKKAPFYKDLLHTSFVPDTVQGARNITLNKIYKFFTYI